MRRTCSEEWKHGEQRKETSTSPPLHNPTRKDPDRDGTGEAPAERKKRQNQNLPRPPRLGNRWLLRLTIHFTWRLHARMPPFILSMGITEPHIAGRAAYGRRVCARHSVRRNAPTQPLQVRALVFLFSYRHDTPRATILRELVGLPEK